MNKHTGKKVLAAATTGAALLAAASVAQAADVTFFDLNDTDAGNYDVGSTTWSGNVLTLGLDNFTASAPTTIDTIAVPFDIAFDTISLQIQAPTGYRITRLVYTEEGSYATDPGTFTYATGSWVVNGQSETLGFFFQGGGPDGSWSLSVDRDIAPADLISVSITNNLIAIAPGVDAAASISKDAANLTVELTAIPIPAAVWMLGSALVGLVAVRRKAA